MAHWQYVIRLGDVFRNEGMTFEQRRDAIVDRLCGSDWYQAYADADDPTLWELVNELSYAEDFDEFNDTWSSIYDLADDGHQAWIDVWTAYAGDDDEEE